MNEGTESGEKSGSRYQEKRQAGSREDGRGADWIEVISLETERREGEDGRPEKKIGKLAATNRRQPKTAGVSGTRRREDDSAKFLRLINSSGQSASLEKKKEDGSAGGQEPTWQERLHQRRIRRLHRLLGCCAGVFAVIYAAAAVYFSAHFYEGRTIYGIDCSQMTAARAKE